MHAEAERRRFTVAEFYKMAEVGILVPGVRSELIDGEIIEMSPMGALHRAAVNRASDYLIPLFQGKAHVSVQLPIRLDEFNEPEPDLAFLRPREDFYKDFHPGPADVYMVMEVSDSSHAYDREVKLPMYAASRVPEVWIEDLASNRLCVFRDPVQKTCRTSLAFGSQEFVAIQAFPEVPVSVSTLLGTSNGQDRPV